MKIIRRENSTYSLSNIHKPIERVNSGELILFETYDCYKNQIISESQNLSMMNIEYTNPATGPLYIEEAEPGDVLKVEVLDIKTFDSGVMIAKPGLGALADYFNESKIKIVTIKDNVAIFNEKVQLPVNPMIGVIGVAPEGEKVLTTFPGQHGGNMDCKRIVKGSAVYLPVFVKGALLSMGDLHAIMGDGEIVICGLEVNGEVTVRVSVLKNKSLPLPIVIDDSRIMTIASEESLDAAAKQAVANMHKFLKYELDMDSHEAGMLLSLAGNLRICQVVDPLMTVRMEFPLSIINKYKLLTW